jgi:hypothetical protein
MDEPNSSSVGRAMENKKTDFHFAVRRLRCESLELTAQSRKRVGVEIMIAHNPLHGSGQAALPHPALALGDDAHAA